MHSLRIVPLLLLVMVTLVACGGDDAQPDAVTWRNIELQLPDGWYLFEEEEDRLSISNQDIGLGEEPGVSREPPEGETVAMFFTYEPGILPDDWRDFVEQQDAELESDERIVLQDEVPATRLVFSYTTGGIPTREMVVVIPSRSVVVLAQPVPGPGDEDAPEVFLAHIDRFLELLQSAEFGPPVLD